MSFEKAFALYRICIRWHSGQSSRGYRLLSRIQSRSHNLWRLEDELKRDETFCTGVAYWYRRFGKLRHTL